MTANFCGEVTFSLWEISCVGLGRAGHALAPAFATPDQFTLGGIIFIIRPFKVDFMSMVVGCFSPKVLAAML